VGKVLEIDIDPCIILNPERIKGMSEDLQEHLKAAITNAAKVYNCHWTGIAWSVQFDKATGQPYVRTKKRD